jgi:DNA-binding transcriptional MerR regulator/DNA gyrase inhibitor GyrI
MYSIGEFSRISGLSIKTLRLYHEKEILVPSVIDQSTGYRYYNRRNAEQARIITHLRNLEFGLVEIADLLSEIEEDPDIVGFFTKKRAEIEDRVRRHKSILQDLDLIIKSELEAKMTFEKNDFQVEEKDVETVLIAGIRFKGKYSDCGEKFGRIGKSMGPFICGRAMNLYYDHEYKEADADIESCLPIRKGKNADGISVRELPGGRCLSLIHKGPYDTISRSYEKIWSALKEKGLTLEMPTREIYLKGPGMIFKGNPENYLTEIQIMVK